MSIHYNNSFIANIYRYILLNIAVALMMGSLSFAEESILILNSDTRVEKYTNAQQAFIRSIGKTTEIFDMSEPSIEDSHFTQMVTTKDPDLIYCIGEKATSNASRLIKNRTKIVSSVMNQDRMNFDKDTYGVDSKLPAGMQINLFRLCFPEIRKIGVLYSKKYNDKWLKSAIYAGRQKGVEIVGYYINKPVDVGWKLKKMIKVVDAIWLISDPIVMASEKRIMSIFTVSEQAKLPVFAYDLIFEKLGATLVISADVETIGGQVAEIALDLFANSTLENRFQPPTGSQISINLKKIETYGLMFDYHRALGMINKIIE